MKEICAPDIFWQKAKIDVGKIAEFAIDLCIVPVFPAVIDLDKFYKIVQKGNQNENCTLYKIDISLKTY